MKKPAFLSVIVVGIIFVTGYLAWFHEDDPKFNGKRLSKHLEQLKTEGFGPPGSTLGSLDEPFELQLTKGNIIPENTRKAIRAQGTNALPMLSTMLQSRKTELQRLWDEFSVKWKLPRAFQRSPRSHPFDRRVQALCAFRVLGTNAAPIVHRITPLLTDQKLADGAIMAIQLIRPDRKEQILSLTNVFNLKDTAPGYESDTIIAWAILTLGSFEEKAIEAAPFIKSTMSSTNGFLRGSSAIALARMGIPANEAIPLITSSLKDWYPDSDYPALNSPPDINDVLMHIWALEQYGADSNGTVPMLLHIKASIANSQYRLFQAGIQKSIDQILEGHSDD